MEIKTQVTKADLVEFQLFQKLRSATFRLRFFSWALLPPSVVAAAGYALTAGRPHLVRLAVFLIVPFYLTLFYHLTRRRLTRKLESSSDSAQSQCGLGDQFIDVGEQGVLLKAGSENVFLDWAKIPRVIVNNTYGYIYTSPDRAIIVPQRCFGDGGAFALFMKVAVIYHWNVQRGLADQGGAVVPPTQQTGTSPMPAQNSQAPIAFVSR